MAEQLPYDSPNHLIRREQVLGRAGGAAATKYTPFRMFQKGTLKTLKLVVAASGTSATQTWQVLMNGATLTTAIALTLANVTGTIGTATINRSVTSLTDVFEILSDTDTAAKVDVIAEYTVDFPSNFT